ncbi:L,D-transpeptidase family protein [Vreelandella zhaodongensis]|uniref:L,D-transpeptidase family protein n=1 Tax=Vreelandella zhaodongensis TaxID=1176240 RepID=UPI003EBAF1FB
MSIAMNSQLNRASLTQFLVLVRRGLTAGLLAWPVWGYGSTDTIPDSRYSLPADSDIIGEAYQVIASEEDTLIDIARTHNVGYEEIRSANPDISLWVPGDGTAVTIPRRHILPNVERTGIVINVAELRLYYYPEVDQSQTPWVETYPIGIGREGFDTPLGITTTTMRLENPAWYPPRSMRQEAAERGEPAPAVVPPGPDNPLGDHAILLDIPGYLIHGTNQPDGIGMRASRGCIRMYPEDISSIFDNVPNGTQVNITDQPIKAGADNDGDIYLQVFNSGEESDTGVRALKDMLLAQSLVSENELAELDDEQLKMIFEQPNDQVHPLSSFYKTPSESSDELTDMDIYHMISQVAPATC